jgi:hypothetical protein
MARRRSGPDPDDEADAAGGPAHLRGVRLAARLLLPALPRQGGRPGRRQGHESGEDGRRPEGQSGAVAEAEASAMTDLDQPATRRDIVELRHELEKLHIKVDAYWMASDRVQRLAFGMLGTAVIAILATAATLILR